MRRAQNMRSSGVYRVIKRGVDFVLAAVMLVALAPLLAAVALVIKLDSPGPVLFRQQRTGKDGRVFEIYKFRSMVASNDVHDSTCEDQHTRVGDFLRRTSIDELPQLFNVLMGQMAFIGPRPWVVEYYANMTERERRRAQVLPGITGLAQAKGRNGLTIFEKINYDLEYVERYSLKMDLVVIALTIKMVLTRQDASSNKRVIWNELESLRER